MIADRTCSGCRWWSEMLAQAKGGGPVEAMCLNQESPNSTRYVTQSQTCRAWQDGSMGAVDQPGGDPYA